MKHEVVEMDSFYILGPSKAFSIEKDNISNFYDYINFCKEFHAHISSIKEHSVENTTYNYAEKMKTSNYTNIVIGLKTFEKIKQKNLVAKKINKCKYLKFTYQGKIDIVKDLSSIIFSCSYLLFNKSTNIDLEKKLGILGRYIKEASNWVKKSEYMVSTDYFFITEDEKFLGPKSEKSKIDIYVPLSE